MCRIIEDFINGCGYFEGDENVMRYTQAVSRSQVRKFKRYGIVPAAFFQYLEETKAISAYKYIPEKYRTLYLLLDLLWVTPKRNNPKRSEGEILRVEILKDLMPWIENSLGSAQHLYIKGELYNGFPKRKRYNKRSKSGNDKL
jgi:hypothetical protein